MLRSLIQHELLPRKHSVSSNIQVNVHYTTHSVDETNPGDPYGVAKFDLSELMLGQQTLHLKAPIHACSIPDVLGVRDGKQDGKLMGVAGAVDGPGGYRTPIGGRDQKQDGKLMGVVGAVDGPGGYRTLLGMRGRRTCGWIRCLAVFAFWNFTWQSSKHWAFMSNHVTQLLIQNGEMVKWWFTVK